MIYTICGKYFGEFKSVGLMYILILCPFDQFTPTLEVVHILSTVLLFKVYDIFNLHVLLLSSQVTFFIVAVTVVFINLYNVNPNIINMIIEIIKLKMYTKSILLLLIYNKMNNVNLDDWKTVASLSSSYKKFEDKHKNDVEKLGKSPDNITLSNMSTAWKNTIQTGINELKNTPTTPDNNIIVNETINDLNKALYGLNKIAPKKTHTSLFDKFKNISHQLYKQPTKSAPKPLCSNDESICTNMKPSIRHHIKTLVQKYKDKSLLEYKCCVDTVFLDTSIIDYNIKYVFNLLNSLSTLIIYYNTKKETIIENIPEKIRKQITTIETVTTQDEDETIFIPFDYLQVFPSLLNLKGMYTSAFSFSFKYITNATLCIDNEQLLQFNNLPNIENLTLKKIINVEDGGIYNLYINNLQKLLLFEDLLEIEYDTIRIHNTPKCKYLNKMIANKIDLYKINQIASLDIIVNEFLSISHFNNLTTLNIKLAEDDVKLKLINLPKLDTLIISGNINLGSGNKFIILDNTSIHKLQTFVVDGDITATNQENIDNFIYELIRNNQILSHININGKSITGPKLYEQYKANIRQHLVSPT